MIYTVQKKSQQSCRPGRILYSLDLAYMILKTKATDVQNKWVPELSQTNDKLAMIVASV